MLGIVQTLELSKHVFNILILHRVEKHVSQLSQSNTDMASGPNTSTLDDSHDTVRIFIQIEIHLFSLQCCKDSIPPV